MHHTYQNVQMPNSSNSMEPQELSPIANRKQDGMATLEDSLLVSYKTKHTLTI